MEEEGDKKRALQTKGDSEKIRGERVEELPRIDS